MLCVIYQTLVRAVAVRCVRQPPPRRNPRVEVKLFRAHGAENFWPARESLRVVLSLSAFECVCRVRLDTAYWSMMRVVVEERRTETIRDAELNCALIEMRMQTNGRPICYAINRFDRIQLKRAPHYVWHIPQTVRPHPTGGATFDRDAMTSRGRAHTNSV